MEYQIVSGNRTHVQKVLNQWRHQYMLEILSYQVLDGDSDSNNYNKPQHHVLLIRRCGYNQTHRKGEPFDG